MNKVPLLSIVIGSYNNEKYTINLINSIYKNIDRINFEIIVIDDFSPDEIYKKISNLFPEIRLIRNSTNLGYTKTYNKGTRLAKGDFILHLNADTLFTQNTNLGKVLGYIKNNNKVGIIGVKALRSLNGPYELNSKRQLPTLKTAIGQSFGIYKFFPNFKSYNYYLTYLNEDKISEVGGLGSFILFRKELIKSVGVYDEDFIIGSDVDFYYRTLKNGWKIIYYPKSVIVHYGGKSVKRFNIKNQIIFHKDLWRYYRKHLFETYPFYFKYIIAISLFFRFFIFLIIELIIAIKKKFIK